MTLEGVIPPRATPLAATLHTGAKYHTIESWIGLAKHNNICYMCKITNGESGIVLGDIVKLKVIII